MLKFLFDRVLAAILLVLSSPVLLISIILVRATSEGPGIFRQIRVGRDEMHFVCYKLRTMHTSTANVPTHEASALAVTRVGRLLRRTKLDELPQLVNVLRGDMSFVGPRPCLPQQEDLVQRRRASGVFTVRPGITGLAQIRGIDMSDPERLALIDAEYLRTRSFHGDLMIMLATVSGRGQGDKIVTTVQRQDHIGGNWKQ